MLYRDRREAGRLLGQFMAKRSWHMPIVLGLPRGGVPVAIEVARSIDADIDIVLSKKIGAPFNPELALGAVDMRGIAVIDSRVLHVYGVTESYIREQVKCAAADVQARMGLYRGRREYPDLEGRDVILVDDGIATGHTLISAARSLAGKGAAVLAMATPVCPPDVVHRLEASADLVMVLSQPSEFESVSQCYEDYRQLTDDQVQAALREAWGIS